MKKHSFNILTTFLLLLTLINCNYKSDEKIFFKTKIDSLFLITKNEKILKKKRYNLQKIENQLDKEKFDTIIRDFYFDLSNEYYSISDKKKYFQLVKKIENKSLNNKDSIGNILAISNLGVYYQEKSNIDSAYYFYDKATKLIVFIKNKPFLESILLKKSVILWQNFDYLKAESLAIESLKIAQEKKNTLMIYHSYVMIGNIQYSLKNYSKANDYFNLALKIINELKNENDYNSLKGYLYNNIGKIYQKQKHHQKAIKTFQKALLLDDFKKSGIPIYCYLNNNLNYSKLKLGNKSVVNKFEETLKIGDSIGSIPIQITSKHYLGEYYLQQKDTIQAIKYLIDAQQLAHKNNIFEDELLILQLLAKANITKEAFYNQRYIHLSDSLQDVERISRDKYARIEYETDQVTEEKKIVEKEKKIISNQFIYFATISVLLLSLLGLLLYNKNKRSKLEKKLHQQQQELDDVQIYNLMQSNLQKIEEGKRLEKQRISRDLHDGVIGKLAAIRMNLYEIKHSQSPETLQNHLQHIGQMKKVEEEIRNLTHELNSDVFSDAINFETMIKILFDEIVSNSKTEIKIESDNRINWNLISNQIKMTTYRIFQEAFHNIHKYADASIVKVTLAKNSTGISIQISDNGKGFNIDTTIKKSGIGIKNMKHRIEELNGQFSIDSIKKVGTKINLVIPLQIDTFEI